jgi:hypothetical protein
MLGKIDKKNSSFGKWNNGRQMIRLRSTKSNFAGHAQIAYDLRRSHKNHI